MPEENLCLDCGLCCDGTMYSSVLLEASDCPERLIELGIGLTRGPKDLFEQPCSAHQSGCCSIYAERPAICREYRCALLIACEAGSVSPDKARSLIQDTIALRNRLRRQVEQFVGAETPLSLPKLFHLMLEKLGSMEPDLRKRVNPHMLLDVGTLRVLLSKRFEPNGTTLAKSSEGNDKYPKETAPTTTQTSPQADGTREPGSP